MSRVYVWGEVAIAIGGRAAHDPRVHGGGRRLLGKDVVELERRCARLEAEVAVLRDRLEQERGQRGLRAVPSPPAMIALRERSQAIHEAAS